MINMDNMLWGAPSIFFCAKIFSVAYDLSKHLPVFLLGTENVVGWWVAIVVVVCGNICGKIEKLFDQHKIGCGTRYEPHDYDSGDKNTKRQKGKNWQKCKKAKRQKAKRQKDKKNKKTKRQKGKKAKRQKGKKDNNKKRQKIQQQKDKKYYKKTTKNNNKIGGPQGPHALRRS